MLKDNLKTIRQRKGLSQEELSIKLHVVRQTISKWESGRSVPDAERLIKISEIFDTPVSEILGENIAEKSDNALQAISDKLAAINEQLALERGRKRKRLIRFLIIFDLAMVSVFILLTLLDSPYQNWDYSDPEWSVIGTFWHGFEWIFFKVAPFAILIITAILAVLLLRKHENYYN